MFSFTNSIAARLKSARIHALLAVVFAAALLPRAAIVLIAPHQPHMHWDVAHDVVIARNLADGHGFANAPGQPTAYRYPLLPFVLSLFFRVLGERYIPFMLFQALLGAATAAIIAWIGYLAGGRRLALLSGFFTAVNPELISFTRMMLTETIFAFLICLAAVFLIRLLKKRKPVDAIFIGLIVGLATHCRPVVLAWAVLVALYLLFRMKCSLGRRVLMVSLIAVCSTVIILPWLARNNRVMGTPVLATSCGITFWYWGHNDAQPGDESTVIPDEYHRANHIAKPRRYFVDGIGDPGDIVPVFSMQPRYQAFSFEQRIVDRLQGMGEVEADAELNKMAMEYIWSNPAGTLRHSVTHLFRTFAFTEMNGRLNIVLTFLMPFLLLGAMTVYRDSRIPGVVVLTCIISMLAIHFLFYFDHRFRVPYQPFMMLLGAAGLLRFVQGNLCRRDRLLFAGWLAIPVIVNYFLVWGNPSG